MLLSKPSVLISLFFAAGLFVPWMQDVTGAPSGFRTLHKAPVFLDAPHALPSSPATPTVHKRGSAARLVGATTLAWSPNQERDVAGYRVYYGTASRTYGPPITIGNVTAYTLGNLAVGATYYFAVTAYDTAGYESGFSNEVHQIIR